MQAPISNIGCFEEPERRVTPVAFDHLGRLRSETQTRKSSLTGPKRHNSMSTGQTDTNRINSECGLMTLKESQRRCWSTLVCVIFLGSCNEFQRCDITEFQIVSVFLCHQPLSWDVQTPLLRLLRWVLVPILANAIKVITFSTLFWTISCRMYATHVQSMRHCLIHDKQA